MINGIPVLINAENSIFAISQFEQREATTFKRGGRLRALSNRLPSPTVNLAAPLNYRRITMMLSVRSEPALVLVLGGSVLGEGMEHLVESPNIRLVESDVALGKRTMLVCDGHDIPIADASFDAVIAQAVLEHVADPARVVAEAHRVLKPDGIIYAETPFMQQVHMAAYDFSRFTHLGHRRLFRQFAEVDSGIVAGPGSALAWASEYFAASLSHHRLVSRSLAAAARLLTFWLARLDRRLARNPAAYDAAAGFYFLGRKADTVLTDHELVSLYRGAQ